MPKGKPNKDPKHVPPVDGGRRRCPQSRGQRKHVHVDREPQHPGAPTLLTDALIDEFKRLLPQCFYIETVAGCLNIDRRTWREWMRKGRAEAFALAADPRHKPSNKNARLYHRFYLAYHEALALGEKRVLKRIGRASRDQWQAGAWLLERRFPERWGSSKREIQEMRRQLDELLKVLAARERELNT